MNPFLHLWQKAFLQILLLFITISKILIKYYPKSFQVSKPKILLNLQYRSCHQNSLVYPVLIGPKDGRLSRPNYEHYRQRLASFTRWPNDHVLFCTALASNGFYHVSNDTDEVDNSDREEDLVVCAFCFCMKSHWTADEDVQTVHHQLSPECPYLRMLARCQVDGNYALLNPSSSLLNPDRNPDVVTSILPTQAEIEQETANGVNERNLSDVVVRNLDRLHMQTNTARHSLDFRASIRCDVGRILSQIQRNVISMSTDTIDRHSSFSSYQQLSSHRRHNSIFFRECYGFLLWHWHGSTRLSVQVLFSGSGLASFTLLTMRHLALTGQFALRHSGSSVDLTLNLQQVVRIFPENVTVLFLQAANHRRPQTVGLNLRFFATGSVFIVYNLH